VVEAGDVGGRLGDHVEDYDLVGTLLEPGAGDVEGLLGAYVPEAAYGVAVDPEGSFAEVVDVEEGVSGLSEGEVGSVEGGGGFGAA
jgi:hypothetical protein